MRPGVQKPHCTAPYLVKLFLRASPRGLVTRPSIVTRSRPSQSTANIRQAFTVSPSTRIVQAPHSPSPQAYFVPVRPILSRSISRPLILAEMATRLSTPFNLNIMSTVADMDQHPLQHVLDELAPIPVGRTHIANRMNFIYGRRDSRLDRGIVERFALDDGLGLRCPDGPRCHGAEGDADVSQSPSVAHGAQTDRDSGDVEGGPGTEFEELADEIGRRQRNIDGGKKFGALALRPAWPDKEVGQRHRAGGECAVWFAGHNDPRIQRQQWDKRIARGRRIANVPANRCDVSELV